MAETSIPVQPAAAAGALPPAALPLKLVAPSDGSSTVIQAVTLFDDQGRALQPMSEATGQRIVQLLTALVAATLQSTGGLLPSDDAAGIANTT
jgi:hypothetical protein